MTSVTDSPRPSYAPTFQSPLDWQRRYSETDLKVAEAAVKLGAETPSLAEALSLQPESDDSSDDSPSSPTSPIPEFNLSKRQEALECMSNLSPIIKDSEELYRILNSINLEEAQKKDFKEDSFQCATRFFISLANDHLLDTYHSTSFYKLCEKPLKEFDQKAYEYSVLILEALPQHIINQLAEKGATLVDYAVGNICILLLKKDLKQHPLVMLLQRANHASNYRLAIAAALDDLAGLRLCLNATPRLDRLLPTQHLLPAIPITCIPQSTMEQLQKEGLLTETEIKEAFALKKSAKNGLVTPQDELRHITSDKNAGFGGQRVHNVKAFELTRVMIGNDFYYNANSMGKLGIAAESPLQKSSLGSSKDTTSEFLFMALHTNVTGIVMFTEETTSKYYLGGTFADMHVEVVTQEEALPGHEDIFVSQIKISDQTGTKTLKHWRVAPRFFKGNFSGYRKLAKYHSEPDIPPRTMVQLLKLVGENRTIVHGLDGIGPEACFLAALYNFRRGLGSRETANFGALADEGLRYVRARRPHHLGLSLHQLKFVYDILIQLDLEFPPATVEM